MRDESDPSAQLQRKEYNSSFPDLLYKLKGWAFLAQPLLFWAVTICFLLGMLSAMQELMGLPTQRERKREIISVVTAREF